MSDDVDPGRSGSSDSSDESAPQITRSPRLERLWALPATPRRLAMRRLAAAGRRVIEAMTSTAATAEQLDHAATDLEAVGALLESLPEGTTYSGVAELANAGELMAEMKRRIEAGDPEAFEAFDHSPFIGLANPLSPPISFEYRDDRLFGTVTFGSAYEGPPGCVHGGYIAAAFDELLGAAQSMSGIQGMTARLEVSYRKPTPLGEPLTLEGWVDRSEGRKIFVVGTMSADEQVTAEATGLFLSLDPERFAALLVDRERRRSERESDGDSSRSPGVADDS